MLKNLQRLMSRVGLLLIIAVAFLPSRTLAADTIRVVTHNQQTVVTDPSTGFRSYREWGVFPAPEDSVRRVFLKVRFGCPDSIRCADWDYLDHIIIRRKGGVGAASLDFEIGRMLTPYGGAFGGDWTFQWITDVTDFASLLRDSVEIEYYHSGYEPDEDRGWKIDVEFEFISGPPVINVVSVRKIYDGMYAYGDSTRPITDSLAPVTFTVADSVDHVRFIVFQTGHGGDDSGCGEFCDKYRELLFDGVVVDKRQIWKRCGDNPLYPQAGTWIYDRANWCPGELVAPDVFDFPVTPGSTHSIGLRMEPYVLAGTDARESISAYLVQYRGPVVPNDMAVDRIIVPSNDNENSRLNPSCMGASIVMRNLGAAPLTMLYIRYGTFGFDDRAYIWNGHLTFNDTARIDLPGDIKTRPGVNTFSVSLLSPNSAVEAYPEDNRAEVSFQEVRTHLSPLVFQLKTNAEPGQNSYVVRNSNGDTVRGRLPGSLRPDTLYSDTLRLDSDCYELILSDSAGDGLEFWYNDRGGRGWARLFDDRGTMLKGFESDFGNEVRYGFKVSRNPRFAAMPSDEPAIGLFPTRTLGTTTLDYFANTPALIEVKIVTDPGGEVVDIRTMPGYRAGIIEFDLTSRGPQRYYLQLFVDGNLKFNKRIRVVGKL